MLTDILLCGGLALFVLFRFLVEPKLANSVRTVGSVLSLRPMAIAKLSVTRFLGTFFGYVTLGAAICKALAHWVESLDVDKLASNSEPAVLETIVSLLTIFRTAEFILPKVGTVLHVAPIILLAIGLLCWSVRSTRGINAAIQREIAELQEKVRKNTLPDIAPDKQMQEVKNQIEDAKQNNADTKSLEHLYQHLLELDLIRRVNPSLLRAAGLDTFKESPWRRATGFMISGVVFKGMRRLAAVTTAVMTVSLAPASLIFASTDLCDSVAKAIRRLEDARRDITLEFSFQRSKLALDKFLDNIEIRDSGSSPESKCPPPDVPNSIDPDVRVLSERDCKTAAEFGRIFEGEWASTVARSANIPLVDRRYGSGKRNQEAGKWRQFVETVVEARQNWARRQVLIESIRARARNSIGIVEADPNDGGRWQQSVLDAELTARAESRPVTRAGKVAEQLLQKILRVQPNAITVEIDDKPLTLSELQAKSISGVISAVIDMTGIEATFPAPLGNALIGAFKGWLESFVAGTYNSRSDAEFFARATEVGAMAVVAEALKTNRITEETMSVLKQLIDAKTAQRYQSLFDRAAEPKFKNSKVTLETKLDQQIERTNIEEIFGNFYSQNSRTPMYALASYSSLFPGVEGQAAHSLQAEVLRVLDTSRAKAQFGPPPGITLVPVDASGQILKKIVHAAPTASSVSSRLLRARSYSALRSSRFVGGVLVGRPPKIDPSSDTLDLRGFTFSCSSDPDPVLKFHLKHNNGVDVVLGPFNPAIVHLALAYAADGRPTTVTMFKADPLYDLKILLHPALVDTGLGCSAILLDQFADAIGRRNEKFRSLRRQAHHNSFGLVALYRQAWAYRLSAVKTKQTNFECDDRTANHILHLLHLRKALASNSLIQRLQLPRQAERLKLTQRLTEVLIHKYQAKLGTIDTALRSLGRDPRSALRPLYERSAYFDKDLVRILEGCAMDQPKPLTSDGFLDCVRDRLITSPLVQHYWRARISSWCEPPPDILMLSGVREKPYTIDADLTFAQPPPSGASLFRFIYQFAIDRSDRLSGPDLPCRRIRSRGGGT